MPDCSHCGDFFYSDDSAYSDFCSAKCATEANEIAHGNYGDDSEDEDEEDEG